MRGPLAAAVGAALIALMTAGSAAMAATAPEQTVKLDVASTFPSTLPLLGDGALALVQKIARASAGRLLLEIHEPGTLVPAADTVEEGRLLMPAGEVVIVRHIYGSYAAFRANYRIWHYLSYLQ